MNQRVGMIVLAVLAAPVACGPSPEPASPASSATPASASAAAPAPSAVAPAAPAPAGASAPAPAPAPTAPAPAKPTADVEVTGVTAVSNEITTPNVIGPDQVIAGLRPTFNTCYQTGLKKDPKLQGSVTLSAQIDKTGKVTAVTPKMLNGLTPVVVKCLTDKVKAANFAPSGGINYATSLDIPVGFSVN